MKEYNSEDFSGQTIIWYEEEGNRISFVADDSNPYYQEYLAQLENEDT